jgi:cell division protein FtsB
VADLEINAQRVYERLANKIARLESENAQLQEGVEIMVQKINELENPPDKAVPDKTTGK